MDQAGARRVLAVADPGSDDARWDFPDDEVLDAGEEIVVAATRAGLGELLHLAATPASGDERHAPAPRPERVEATEDVADDLVIDTTGMEAGRKD
jgi:hypothetical protein